VLVYFLTAYHGREMRKVDNQPSKR
jgi:hypothetical protein